MGDINGDCKDGILSNTKWKNRVELNDLQQVIQSPTRVTAKSETIIDYLYVSSTDKQSDKSITSIALSAHYPICFTRTSSKNTVKRQHHLTIQYRCNKKFTDYTFSSDLPHLLNALIISQTDSNQNFDYLAKNTNECRQSSCTLEKSRRVKREMQPEWINDDIKAAGRKRDINHKLKTGTSLSFGETKRTR